jgi:DNA invertase Pin-like site-specific DNA recombinase
VLFGYARVSTADQNPDHQIDALIRAGVAARDIYVDHASGARASRPQLDIVLRMLRDGDTLKITRLDRLGRSVRHLVTLGAELRERGVGLHVIERASTPRQPKAARCSGCSPSSPNSSAS